MILVAHSLILLIFIKTYDSYLAFIAQPKPHKVVVVMSATGTSAALVIATFVSVTIGPGLPVKELVSLKVLVTVRQTACVTKVARIHTLCNEVAMIMI